MLEDPYSALREDIRLLGGLLGRAIRASQGERIYSLVEEIRAHAKLAVQDESLAIDRINEQLSGMGDQDLCVLARAYSAFLQLANIAEQHHRVRRRRAHQLQQDAEPQPGSLADLFARLTTAGLAPQHIRDAVASMDIELVLTAHPTEVSRRTLIKKYDDIHDSLERMDKQRMTPPELAEEIDLLRCHVLSIWQTDEIRHERPTPEDEARWGFTAIEQTLWQAVPQFMRELDRGMSQLGMPALDMHAAPLRFASWMGGDRDGNPTVTAAVTERVLLLARWMAVELFLRDVEVLRTDLSMQSCTSALQALAGEDSFEPYRDVLKNVRRRLQGTHERIRAALDGRDLPDVEYYAHSDELYKPLLACHDSLIACGMRAIARSGLTDVIRRVACFGLPLMRLDIRQESGRHARVLDAMTSYLGEERTYLAWTEEERLSFLELELENRRPLLPPRMNLAAGHPLLDAEVVETLDTFRMLARSPQDALGAYVISMAHAASDVLAVQLLQKEMGVNPPMRVVPLFETLQDLEDAPKILRTLWASNPYRQLIQNRQEVMIGYSDSAKDAGFMAASWAQYRAQERLALIAEEAGVTLSFFHGRGGSVSRGGAPAHQALLSQPPGTIRGRIRITEQGEMIRFKFGVPGVALRNLELYASATLEASLCPPPEPHSDWRRVMDNLSLVALNVYRETVALDPRLVPYMRQVTPELDLQRLPLGSRPARRSAEGGVAKLRAIPWVFAWTQIRLMLPAWLGTGRALNSLMDAGEVEVLRTMSREWPYFNAMMDMLEMVLAKSDLDVVRHYEHKLTQDPTLRALGESLRQRLGMTLESLLRLNQGRPLLALNPVLKRSIELRTPYILPLHLLQAEIMARQRDPDLSEARRKLLDRGAMVTIAGIAAGLRNTG